MLDDSPPCCRLQGRLSQTEISHFGSSLHLKDTETKSVGSEHSGGAGRDGGLRRQKTSKEQHYDNSDNKKNVWMDSNKCITVILGKKILNM